MKKLKGGDRCKKKKIMKMIIVMIIIVRFVIPQEIVNNLYLRMTSIFGGGLHSEKGDQSTIVRFILIYCGLCGFIHSPIIGYGAGNFSIALNKFVVLPANILARNEILQIMSMNDSTTYSFYSTSLCDGGLLGMLMIICVVRTLRKGKSKEGKQLKWIIIYLLVQLELFGTLPIAIWLAVYNIRPSIIDEDQSETHRLLK